METLFASRTDEWSRYLGLATFNVVLPGEPRIVHLLNRHYIPADLYAQSVGVTVTETEGEHAHAVGVTLRFRYDHAAVPSDPARGQCGRKFLHTRLGGLRPVHKYLLEVLQ
jgi:hypothetical protein